jgi:hypothetical protein
MRSDRDLGRALEHAQVPDETGAEQRAWEVVRAAHAGRSPAPRRGRSARILLAVGGAAAVLAVGLSPAGARVGDFVEDVGEAMGIGVDDARPALRSLPAAGELLVDSGDGIWIVRDDGSKRRLGDYEQAAWSPRGLFVVVARGSELLAIEPDGTVRWSLDAPGRVRDPRWSPSGFRIAYRAGGDLWVVAGDGSAERRIAFEVAPQAPAWRPAGSAKLSQGGFGTHVLRYVAADGEVRVADVDTARPLEVTPADRRALFYAEGGDGAVEAVSPDGRRLARLDWDRRRARLAVGSAGGRSSPRILFSGPGRFTPPVWSPDGRWILIGWPEADQWLFIDPAERRRPDAVDAITRVFDPGDTGSAGFPRPVSWALPQR